MDIYSIYKITNTINGKVYIGFTSKTLKQRLASHNSASKKGKTKFHRALRCYGFDSFECVVIYQSLEKEHCLNVMEPYFINLFDSVNTGYNISFGGIGNAVETTTKLHKLTARELMLVRWKDENYRNMMIQSHIEKWKEPNYINFKKESLKKLWADDSWRESVIEKRSKIWSVTKPDGVVVIVKNLKQWAADNEVVYHRLRESIKTCRPCFDYLVKRIE